MASSALVSGRRGLDGTRGRLASVDLYRGIVMFLLIAESAGIYQLLTGPSLEGSIIYSIGTQFQHSPWRGLRLWDLGMPMFLFVSGIGMHLSYCRRWASGEGWKDSLGHALKRSLVLFAVGWAIYGIVPLEEGQRFAFLYDVLPQLAFACLLAFLILKRSVVAQLSMSFGLVALTELSYRAWAVLEHQQPFVAGNNFGSWVDRAILGSVSSDNWVAFNILPLTALVIWGVLAGRMLHASVRVGRKVLGFVLLGMGGISIGLAGSLLTPVIRRIATSSFLMIAGGACFLALGLACWLADMAKVGKGAVVFMAVGMNPILIYLFSQTEGPWWLGRIAAPFCHGLLGWAGVWPAQFLESLATLALMCGFGYWLYRHRIYVRI